MLQLTLGIMYFTLVTTSALSFTLAFIRIMVFKEREFHLVTRDFLMMTSASGILALVVQGWR